MSPWNRAKFEARGLEYGVDFAQEEVPPFPYFNLIFSLTEGDITKEEQTLDGLLYSAYAYVSQKIWQNTPQNDPQPQTDYRDLIRYY